MIKTYSKKNIFQKKKELDPFDQLSLKELSYSSFNSKLSPIKTSNSTSNSVFPRHSSPFLSMKNDACLNKKRSIENFEDILSTNSSDLNSSQSFQETNSYSFLNNCFVESNYNDSYFNEFDFNSSFFSSENLNNDGDNINSQSDSTNIEINASITTSGSEPSIYNKSISEEYSRFDYRKFEKNKELTKSIKDLDSKLENKTNDEKPKLSESISEEKSLETFSKENSGTSKISTEGVRNIRLSLRSFNKMKNLDEPENLDDSIVELRKRIENITVRRKEGNCCQKHPISREKFKNKSFLKGAGDHEPVREISSESVNRRLTLCRRQSHRVIPIGETIIHEKTLFRTLHTQDVLEETFENSSLDETDITYDKNLISQIAENSLLKNDEFSEKWKEFVLFKCEQNEFLDFDTFYNQRYAGKCKKIGEGVFGEVFGYNDGERKSVIKIIPIEGDQLVNGEPQKNFQEILSEIIITQELSNLRKGTEFKTACFIELIGCYCLKGKYPDELITLWNDYDDEKESENESPLIFEDDQLYLVLELTHGGLDLEAFEFNNSRETVSIFKQVTFALAVAECSLEFEHRDLHWGNLLISRTNNDVENFTLFDKTYSVPTSGVKVSIIDFTLSRMTYDNCYVFNDLALDPSLFTSSGDDYQFEIYRKMQSKVGNNWSSFEPFNNILWIHYILDKMKNEVRYNNVKSRTHNSFLRQIFGHFDKVLHSKSAAEYALDYLASNLQ